ncbi:Protein phosphatase 2C [Rhynchospora pubera]|uniref:protein-serine/threonine phosphatase n=1 Tax=Rhynchospora pubera TaxID=906938 RepID=A0AAV8D682_9POAL|nr:Protein phosphatase 2C [Rhynchospora pubera]
MGSKENISIADQESSFPLDDDEDDAPAPPPPPPPPEKETRSATGGWKNEKGGESHDLVCSSTIAEPEEEEEEGKPIPMACSGTKKSREGKTGTCSFSAFSVSFNALGGDGEDKEPEPKGKFEPELDENHILDQEREETQHLRLDFGRTAREADLESRPDPQSEEEYAHSLGAEQSVGSPCSVNSDCSSVASSLEDFSASFPDGFEPGISSADMITGVDLLPSVDRTEIRDTPGPCPSLTRGRSVFLLDYVPLWGFTSICGRRPEMEDAVAAVPRFFQVPLKMLTSELHIDGLDPNSFRLPAHFFGVYDGHGGAQVANYCRERVHEALVEELHKQDGCSEEASTSTSAECTSTRSSSMTVDFKKNWERAFVNCFQKVDDEVGGKVRRCSIETTPAATNSEGASDPVAPETVGSTAVVAVICSSHIIVANCGDSRAVLCRGKLPMPLSVDHKPNREDEYARIEADGGKVIQWNGYRVFGVLAMSRSIGDRYLKPWIIPVPEVTVLPRARDDECLILASDGLWDVMSNEEACEMARKRILLWHKKNGTGAGASSAASSERGGDLMDPASQAAAEYLSKQALQKGSKDNITVVVIDLKAQRKFKSKT